MPRAEIASKQAVYTLGILHAELAGKLLANKMEAIRLRTATMQVEAVVKMLQPGFNVAGIAAKRRNKSNPWFKRGTLFRSAVDVLRRAQAPMTVREIADALVADWFFFSVRGCAAGSGSPLILAHSPSFKSKKRPQLRGRLRPPFRTGTHQR